jgi:hypothetical protein
MCAWVVLCNWLLHAAMQTKPAMPSASEKHALQILADDGCSFAVCASISSSTTVQAQQRCRPGEMPQTNRLEAKFANVWLAWKRAPLR